MTRRLFAFAAGLVLAASVAGHSPPPALAQEPFVVEGRVTNGTEAGGGADGLTVVLHQDSETGHEDLEVSTGPAGEFRFEGVEMDSATVYALSVTYQGALYGADVDLSSADTPISVEITVYEATGDVETLSAASASVLFATADEGTRSVAALEIVELVNASDRTYVAGPEPMDLIRFGLPPDAHSLRVDTRLPSADFVQVDLGFALLAAVPPGQHEILYTYEFPYFAQTIELQKSFNYGADHLRVLAPVDVLKLSSGRLGAVSTTLIGDREYQLLETGGIERGTSVDILLDGLPQPGLAARVRAQAQDIRFELAAPVALGLLMALLIAFALWRRPERQGAVDGAEPAEAEGRRE